MDADHSGNATGSPTAVAIRDDIEETRERMGETLEELGDRLNPSRLKAQVKESVREATIGRVETMAKSTMDKASDAGRSISTLVRENPLPIALITAGIGWLAMNARSRNSSGNAGALANASHGVTDRVADQASAVAGTIADSARKQSTRLTKAVEQNPLAVGAVAAALGIAAGFLVPSTHVEDELVGEARDDFVDKARALVHEKSEQVQHVAERVVSETAALATDAAREEGLLN